MQVVDYSQALLPHAQTGEGVEAATVGRGAAGAPGAGAVPTRFKGAQRAIIKEVQEALYAKRMTIKDLFRKVDDDRDGYISVAALAKSLGGLGVKNTEAELSELLHGSGASEK